MHFDMHLNDNVIEYNGVAHTKLVGTAGGALVDSYRDMYTVITDKYVSCSSA
jgi:hypothetical protein